MSQRDGMFKRTQSKTMIQSEFIQQQMTLDNKWKTGFLVTANYSKSLVLQATSITEYISQVLKTSDGRDKVLALLQYIAEFYHSCSKHSSLIYIKELFLQNEITSIRLAYNMKESLSQARKTFRLLKFIDIVKVIQRNLKSTKKQPLVLKVVQVLMGVSVFMYYLSDNLLWLLKILIISKIYRTKEEKEWKNKKNTFSFMRIVLSIFNSIWQILIRNRKVKMQLEELTKMQEPSEQVIQEGDKAEYWAQKFLKTRRKIRFDYLQIFIDLTRLFMLYKGLKLPMYKQVDPIFVSFCGLLQSIGSVFKMITEKKIFISMEKPIEKKFTEKHYTELEQQIIDWKLEPTINDDELVITRQFEAPTKRSFSNENLQKDIQQMTQKLKSVHNLRQIFQVQESQDNQEKKYQ